MIGANEYSYGLACGLVGLGHDRRLKKHKPLDVFGFMEKCSSAGLDGVQLQDNRLESLEEDFLTKVRSKARDLGLRLEFSHSGTLSDPNFRKFVHVARQLECDLIRTSVGLLLRQTTIKTREDWHRFREATFENARRVAKLGSEFGVKVAIENHLDLTAEELLQVVEIDPEHLGICLDTANSFGVAQTPKGTAEILGKYAVASHLKDFLAIESSDGCTLYSVRLGEGHVDLGYCVNQVRKYNPNIMFTIEIVSGRTFKIPFLGETFYSGFDTRDALDIVKVLRLVRDNPRKVPRDFIHITEFGDDQLEYEDSNVHDCIAYARNVLKL